MLKTSYQIIFIIIIILFIIYLFGQKEDEAIKVTVEITKDVLNAAQFNESEREGLIRDIILNKVSVKKLAAPKGNDMYLPGISVALFRNRIMISEWTSVPVGERGTYELIVGLNEPVNKGDVVSIAVYVNDDKGKVIIGKKKDVVWD
ncbi:MAG: hypothetical protein WC568_06895 [Candidatus Methanoperedens sp.]